MDNESSEAARAGGSGQAEGGSDEAMDYSELWLMAQRAHKDCFAAALKKDWLTAMVQAEVMASLGNRLANWFEDAHLTSVGK